MTRHCKFCAAVIPDSANPKKVFCDAKCNTEFKKAKSREKFRSSIKTCVICKSEYNPTRPIQKTCSDECEHKHLDNIRLATNARQVEKRRKESLIKFKDADPTTYVECGICGFKAEHLGSHIHVHDISLEEYKEKYGQVASLERREAVMGENNPAYGHGGKYSPFSKNFIKYDELSDEEVDAKINSLYEGNTQTRIDNCSNPTTIEYYMNKGMSDVEAKKALSERQRTFSLEKCIERYGEIEGRIAWEERQQKWLTTLSAKSDSEKAEINRKKIPKSSIKSKSEISLLLKIQQEFGEIVTQQFKMKRPNSNRHVSFDIKVGNAIIEFNGDFWHANPKFFSYDDKLNFPGKRKGYTAKEIWDFDNEKNQIAIDAGFKILTVWENDYTSNPDGIIQYCINFIKSNA